MKEYTLLYGCKLKAECIKLVIERLEGGLKMERKYKILIADNDPFFVKTTSKALENEFEIIVSQNRKESLEKSENEMPDIIILGYLEPRGDSFKFHKDIRNKLITKAIPILVVDVSPEEHSRKGWRREEGVQMEAEDYISRPVNTAELIELINEIIQKTSIEHRDVEKVLEQMESVLKRIDSIEKELVKV